MDGEDDIEGMGGYWGQNSHPGSEQSCEPHNGIDEGLIRHTWWNNTQSNQWGCWQILHFITSTENNIKPSLLVISYCDSRNVKMAPAKRIGVYWVERHCTEEVIVAGWILKQAGVVGDPGTDEEQHHRHTYRCYIELRPVPGQQYNLTDKQKHCYQRRMVHLDIQYGKVW